MNLEDEIIIVQFAQGHHAEVDLLDSFRQLDQTNQYEQLFYITALLQRLKLTDAEIEQANARNSSGAPSNPLLIRRNKLNKVGVRINMALIELENSHKILLDLFKKGYQRSFDQEKASSHNWIYRDLSSSNIVQGILMQHKAMVDGLYGSISFRSEFISLARLWHDRNNQRQLGVQEPDVQEEVQTRFDFISYDGIMEKSVTHGVDKTSQAIFILLSSLHRAVSKQYGLDTDRSERLVLDVMEKYYQDSYTSRYDE